MAGNIRTDGNKTGRHGHYAAAITLSGTPDTKACRSSCRTPKPGSVYRFEAHVEAGISGNGRDQLLPSSNDGGGAGGVWDASAGYIAERRAAAAGSTQACSVSGIYSVTSPRIIDRREAVAANAGRCGSVGAGKAQMSATLL